MYTLLLKEDRSTQSVVRAKELNGPDRTYNAKDED